jgi:hypothetical protein
VSAAGEAGGFPVDVDIIVNDVEKILGGKRRRLCFATRTWRSAQRRVDVLIRTEKLHLISINHSEQCQL